ncbi:type I-B CRISPR-associated protein Cas8b1/Cst1 [Novosphingobium sp. FSY-8]|uniref:Type I-B CRISPR-associated protein Cas8b1/Cst1 n=1 Tax=Novosphingobium ovatum TaxID=1908523 RepID=A0ABW9XA63_9SPHN|nr:GFA family protein [Novosphingobium ovatum]NBC35420.1 type I-B CRISPR-associated protein Cas8b1/Cst1 [Novosphingobium ovatum]
MQSYHGACHCGAVTFTIRTDPAHSVRCDCSICRRRGGIMLRCDAADLDILSGREHLATYRFGTQVAQHHFCRECGVYTFHRMRKLPDKYAVNAGCLTDLDLTSLTPILIKGSEV